MTEHFNKLTPAEHERLTLLQEELLEAGIEICKIKRHGYESHHPDQREAGSNRERLCTELGHVACALSMMIAADDVFEDMIDQAAKDKRQSVKPYLHHQGPVPAKSLDRIASIIEAVDHRAQAADGPVTPTLQEMTQEEITEIYELATRARS